MTGTHLPQCDTELPGDSKRHNPNPSAPHRFIETLLDNLPGMAYRCANDRPWTMSFVSAGFESITGYERTLVLENGFRWAELIHRDDRNAARATVSAALRNETRFDLQYRIVDRAGMEKWVREQGCAVYAEDGSIEAIEGYIDDITVLKQMNMQLEQTEAFYEEQARERRERLNAIIENAPVGIVTYRCGGPFQSANDAFCRMTGFSVSELRERTMLELTHPDDRAESAALDEEIRRGAIDTYSQSKRYIHKNGSTVDVNVVNAVTYDGSGRPSLIIGQVLNVTEQLKAQVEIRRHQEELARADRLHTLGEMATGIAHELNQPLTAISLFAQTGRRLLESGDHKSLSQVFDKLSKHSRRAGFIIERMQDMARHTNRAKQVVDLNGIMEEIVELAEMDARTSGIDIELDLDTGPLEAKIDDVQIQQVTLNLLRNGMDAMRACDFKNGNTIRVRTRRRCDGFLEVAVIDRGTGVSDEVADRLFDSFSTSKETGLGLGLPISNAIITAHGGRISFANNPNGGATFTFLVPAVEDDG